MTRTVRPQSEFDIYHVTARGVNKQVIFEDDADRIRLGKGLRKQLNNSEAELYAWCFMQNHIHLLLHCNIKTLAHFMKLLLAEYVSYYNRVHERSGHLFQGRYYSKPITDESQLMATIRYIHQNPLDIEVKNLSDYRWSSYSEYTRTPFITNVSFPLELFGGVGEFISKHEIIETDGSLEPEPAARNLPEEDDRAILRAKELIGCEQLSEIASADKAHRNEMIALLKANGFPTKQIARITGISRSVVQRVR